jgi:antitoxin component YwqK of YwqJK toxin-antitoxin module
MENGKENGITRSFNENGNLTEEKIYEHGVEKSKRKIK